MKADIIDHDELETGERREGSFESVFSWFQKMAGTLFTGLSGFVVVMVGFDIGRETEQAEGVFTRIIYLMALVPVGLTIIQCWIIYNWPLKADVVEGTRVKLEARRGAIN